MLGEQVQRAVVLQVILQQELLVLVLDEILGVALPRAQIDLRKEVLRHQLEYLARPVLSALLFGEIAVWDRNLKYLTIKFTSLCDLRLQVLELDRRDKDTNTVGVASCIALAPLVEAVDVDDLEGGD